MLSLCDTHTHLAFNHFDHDRDNILKQLEDGYLKFLIEVGTTLEDSKRAIELASRSEKIFVAVGVHPHESSGVTDGYLNELKKLAKKSTVVAIGEVGLDYFRDLSPREIQQKVFYEQLLLAQELDMPVVIHIRDAYNEAYEILKKFSGKLRGVIHAFSGTLEDALRFTELGFKLGIGGPITYPKNNKFREIVKILPIETLIPETDCPYLPPQPYRGKRNEPAYVRFVIEKISELKDLPVRTCADILCANAASLFSLDV
ncbi:TatD family hydrolase [Kosmotoga pacifica]|uniref:TatD family hydrolase n=1 Tax=Kosmotoga pacifica TaxID=1330330 RepID=UPI0009E616D3|nr:TatD family hydrolase [Kosmotoga pacifica]